VSKIFAVCRIVVFKTTTVHFDRSDLQQFTDQYIDTLHSERVRDVLKQMRQDLMSAHDRLGQNPTNSSAPSSTRKPWERNSKDSDKEQQDLVDEINRRSAQEADSSIGPQHADNDQSNAKDKKKSQTATTDPETKKRKPGKQHGAPGFGRTQKLAITETQIHKPTCCRGCGGTFDLHALFQATGGYCSVEIAPPEPGKIGLIGSYTKHLFGSIRCACGFETTTAPKRADKESGWSVEMGEWRLIGPKLLAFLVFAKLRLHLTISKTCELLCTWFGISLSKGCVGTALLEAGRAASCLEPELIAALRAAGLLNVDETSWKEWKITRWLWVAVSDNIAYYAVGPRSAEMAQQILGDFSGWLMTDGYCVYRSYSHRLRCWSHLERKGKALKDSWDKNASTFGSYVVDTFKALRERVYEMRKMHPDQRNAEMTCCEEERLKLTIECLRRQDTECEKTRAFAREVLNDHDAIFTVLQNPDLPLTNNLAEQKLRFMVILRKICYGSKSEEGSRAIAILASVTETLLMRGHIPWEFFTQLFRDRRSGHPPPHIPVPT
jgi:hypothetical protein